MAQGDYRFRIPSEPEISRRGIIRFDTFVEHSQGGDPEAWILIPQGHFSLDIPGTAVAQASTSGQVLTYMANTIRDMGLIDAYEAKLALYALLPNSEWPENDVVRTISLEA
jgi:hypothetical protein